MLPSLTTLMAPSRSALPVSMMRTVSGARSRTRASKLDAVHAAASAGRTRRRRKGRAAAIFRSAASPPAAVSSGELAAEIPFARRQQIGIVVHEQNFFSS